MHMHTVNDLTIFNKCIISVLLYYKNVLSKSRINVLVCSVIGLSCKNGAFCLWFCLVDVFIMYTGNFKDNYKKLYIWKSICTLRTYGNK